MEFDIFHEIIFENKPVGFISFKRNPQINNYFEIMDAYIIPQYRGNNLFFDNLSFLFLFDNFEYFARKPTKAFINVLLKNDYAFKINSDFAVSYLTFMADAEEVYKNPKIKRFYKTSDVAYPYKTHLFDMDLCSVMFRDPLNEIIKENNFFALTEPRKYDIKKYNCRKKLKRIGKKYIDKKFSIWKNNSDKIEKFLQTKEDELAEELLVENTLGCEDELTDTFIDALEKSDLSTDEGFKILKHINTKLDSGELNEKSYYQRVLYLLEHFEVIDKKTEEYDENIKSCPFCGHSIPDYTRSCPKCGLHIRDIDFEEHAEDNLMRSVKDYSDKTDFFDDTDPREELDDEELTDLEWFVKEHMLDYDFDEFLKFYITCDKNLGIEKIKNLFLDNKLNKSLGTQNEFRTYFLYIVHHFYYNEEMGRYDDAFIKLVQMAVLASNKAEDKDNILESSLYATDVLGAVEILEYLDYTFDVSKLFNEAVNTFKIEKYNNNHEEVLRELKEIFN